MNVRARGRRQAGFTFVELMTVLVVIGILAGLLFPRFLRARHKAIHNACVQNIRNIATALESYSIDNANQYPVDLATLTVATSGKQYISSLPTCPSLPGSSYFNGGSNYEVSADGRLYTIICPGVHNLSLAEVRPNYPQYYSSGVLIDR